MCPTTMVKAGALLRFQQIAAYQEPFESFNLSREIPEKESQYRIT